MRIAILTDLHANREALSACLEHAADAGAERYAFLGDLVGYGADPEWTLDTVMAHADKGAIVICGNHDAAVVAPDSSQMHDAARQVIDWTRARLDAAQMRFLQNLPLQHIEGELYFGHANAWNPGHWEYIIGEPEARRSMLASQKQRYSFFGHTHLPMLFHLGATGKAGRFQPSSDIAIPLIPNRHWLALPGACGQPRDGDPAACYALFDTASHELTFHRIAYDHHGAAARIRAEGLPDIFAERLTRGG